MAAALVLAAAGIAVLVLHRPLTAFSKERARMPAPDPAHTFGVIGIGVAFLVMAAVITSNQ